MSTETHLAIVGMKLRFPDADSPESFWENLCAGKISSRRFSAEELLAAGHPASRVEREDLIPVRAPLQNVDQFDHQFFQITPKEAAMMDPQHRVFLELAVGALEDAAIVPQDFEGPIGVFAGCSQNTYLLNHLMSWPALIDEMGLNALIGGDKDHLATRVAYKLGLTGPALTVQTACSTSLAALHLAGQALLDFSCDLALAGASSIACPTVDGHEYQASSVYSADGSCRPFSSTAQGTFAGDGAAVVALRRLSDALTDGDPIHAVLLATAINNDGDRKVSYSAPSVQGQREVIASTHALADVQPSSIQMVEAHGTATALGDPVELAGLKNAFIDVHNGSTVLTAVKANVGHLNTAAGMAGLLKAVLSLRHAKIPGIPNLDQPNPALRLHDSPFVVSSSVVDWPNSPEPKRAGVSSFGAGGTNAHALLQEAPPTPGIDSPRRTMVLTSVGQKQFRPQRNPARARHPPGRPPEHQSCRCKHDLVARSGASSLSRRGVCQHPQRRGPGTETRPHAPQGPNQTQGWVFVSRPRGRKGKMGKAWFETSPEYRTAFEDAAHYLNPHLERPLVDCVFGADAKDDDFRDPQIGGAAIFATGYALSKALVANQVEPALAIGHSTGEYAAAVCAGSLSLKAACTLLMGRARLLQEVRPGAALRVEMDPELLEARLPDEVWIGLVHSDRLCVAVGDSVGLGELERILASEGVGCRRIPVDVAPHCPWMREAGAKLHALASTLDSQPPSLPWICGSTGDRIEDPNPSFWTDHLVDPVDFPRAMDRAQTYGPLVWLELGTRRLRGPFGETQSTEHGGVSVVPANPNPSMHWKRCDGDCGKPAWMSEMHWIPIPADVYICPPMSLTITDIGSSRRAGSSSDTAKPILTQTQRPNLDITYRAPKTEAERLLVEVCQELLGVDNIGMDDDFTALGADSLITLRLVKALELKTGQTIPPELAFGGLSIGALSPHLENVLPQTDRPKPKAAKLSRVVPLSKSGHRAPLFLCIRRAGLCSLI